MMHLRHPNLVLLLHVITQEQPRAVVLEYMDGGSLIDWLKLHAAPEQTQLLSILHQVACGMASLESHSIGEHGLSFCPSTAYLAFSTVHRDLAARNVLVSDYPLVAKVSDFGLSRAMRLKVGDEDDEASCYYRANTSRPMPVRWMVSGVLIPAAATITPRASLVQAPETILTRKFAPSTDVWAFGCLIHEMWTGGLVSSSST